MRLAEPLEDPPAAAASAECDGDEGERSGKSKQVLTACSLGLGLLVLFHDLSLSSVG